MITGFFSPSPHGKDLTAKWTNILVVEKSNKTTPAIYGIEPASNGNSLHAFTGISSFVTTFLAPRRAVPVKSPIGNGKTFMSIFTSTGFQNLRNEDYVNALISLRPDIAIPLTDQPYGERPPVAKKQVRMVERTENWLEEFFRLFDRKEDQERLENIGTSIFAPILPVEHSMQWEYLQHLEEELSDRIAGLAISDVDILPEINNGYPFLAKLPKLSVCPITTPHHLIRQIELGIDIITIPFLNRVSDAGVAMTFSFPTIGENNGVQNTEDFNQIRLLPLGINLWDESYKLDLKPLMKECTCYTCQNHHRAFIQHLLNAREMLAWVLLQIHNYHNLHIFFDSIRATLKQSPENWSGLCSQFALRYESEFPEGTGERPRARGYNFKSPGGGPKINEKSWQQYERENEERNNSRTNNRTEVLLPDTTVSETPLRLDESMDAQDLDERGIGFAEIEKKSN